MPMTELGLSAAFQREHQRLSLAAIVAFGALPAVLCVLATMLAHDFALQGRIRAGLAASYNRRIAVREVFSLLQDAETGQRGYLLTGDPAYLTPYTDAVRAIPARISALRQTNGAPTLASQLGTDQAADARALAALDALSTAKLDELRTTVQLRRSGDLAAAMAMVRSDQGRRDMERIRALMRGMDASLDRARAQKLRAFSAAIGQTMAAAIGLGVFLFTSLGVTGAIVFSAFRHRRRLAQRLEDAAVRQAAVLDSAVDAIVSLNPSGSIETINAAGERMFGYGAAALNRRDIRVLLDMELKPEGPFLSRLGLDPAQPAKSVVHEGFGITSDGRRFPVDVAFGPMELEAGCFVVAIIRDISERRRAEEIKDQFISAVSHELRTPLTSITGSLGLLHGGAVAGVPEAAQRLIGIAYSNSERLGRLVNDILDIEKIQSGRMAFDDHPLDLRALFRESAEQMEGYAQNYGVSIRLMGDETPVWVRGDAARLGQVAANLISNAVKFSPEGGEVRVAFAQRGGVRQVSVSDDGPGIPQEFRSRIFSRFAQADNSDTRQRGGTGLGLAICKEIVERHGGQLFFKSEVGKGSRFFVNLRAPADKVADSRAQDDVLASVAPAPRVLVCEDDLEMCEFLKALVKAEGGEAELVHSLGQARVALAEGGFACALLDLNLPDGDGLEFLRGVPSPPGAPPLPVIIVSAQEKRNLGSITTSLELIEWVEKPIAPKRLRQALRMGLDRWSERIKAERPVVLHVEDDPDVLSLVGDLFRDSAQLLSASTVSSAKHVLATTPPDLVILDVGLADGSGLALLPFLTDARGRRIPTIVFSAQDCGSVAGKADAVLTKSKTSLGQLALEAHRLLQTRPARAARKELA